MSPFEMCHETKFHINLTWNTQGPFLFVCLLFFNLNFRLLTLMGIKQGPF